MTQNVQPVETRRKGKIVFIFALLAVLVLVAGLIMLRMERNRLLEKEQEQSRIKLNAVAEVIRSVETMREASRESFEKRMQQYVRFVISALSDEMEKGDAPIQTLFEDGAVVEIRDNEVIWPEGSPAGLSGQVSAEDIRKGLRLEREFSVSAADPETGMKRFIILSGQIKGNYYYVDWTEEKEILSDEYAYLKDELFLNLAEEYFGGAMLLVSAEDSSLPLISKSSAFEGAESAADLGFTREMIGEERRLVQVQGEECLCAYTTVADGTATLIYTKPTSTISNRSIARIGMAMMPALVILVTMVVYILSVISYVREKRLSRTLENRYRPEKFRRIILMAGLTGAIAVVAISMLFQTLDSLHEENVVSAKSLSQLFEYLQDNIMQRKAYDREQDADWTLFQGQVIAAQVNDHPEAVTREKLQEYCDILDIDFIMLFDSEGKEIASNSDYSGFTMDAGLGENSSDFRRLLMGVPSVVHDVSTDPITGLTRQMVGVSLPLESDSRQKKHGALIMALVPRQLQNGQAEGNAQLQFLDKVDRLFLFADKETGEILYANDSDVVGKKVTEIGMPEASLREGYTDFAHVNGVDSYVTRVSQKSVAFYYIVSSTTLFSDKLPETLGTLIAFLAILMILVTICMYGYSETFKQCVRKNGPQDTGNDLDSEEVRDQMRHRVTGDLIAASALKKDRWGDWTPERQARLILKLDILILIALPAILVSGRQGFGGNSLLHFILYGDWMRGLNLFSFCGIMIVGTVAFLSIIVCNALLSLIAGFSGRGGETICRLLYSLCRYVAVLSVLYYVFEYIGISMSTYVASLGMVSLALSLGSRDMVSDIVSGIMILFEHQFQVGDYVELDGSRGKVLEMGIRSTKLLTASNDVKYISNSGIRSVLNKSKNFSFISTELVIVTGEPLEAIEEKFRAALPEIARKTRKIKGDLTMDGISRVSGGGRPDRDKTVSIRFRCECRESDFDEVRDFVNREIYLFCERENIEIR